MTTDPTAQPTPTPAASAHRPTVLWQVDVLDEDVDLSDPVQVAQAAYHRILSSRMLPVLRVLLADGTTVDVDLDARHEDAVTTVATTPTSAPVAVPEGGWREADWIAIDAGGTGVVYRREANGTWWRDDIGGRVDDSDVARWTRHGAIRYVHAPREDAPRPEPTPEKVHVGVERDTEMGGVSCSECGWHLAGRDTLEAGVMEERQRQHDEHHAPRPEPVTAPLSSDDIEQAIRKRLAAVIRAEAANVSVLGEAFNAGRKAGLARAHKIVRDEA